MAKVSPHITEELAEWIRRQHLFFVASAPMAASGHVNCSPKGGDSFRILGPLEVVYQDFTGSGAETIAHLNENGRIVIMFCAFEGRPKVARLHGTGRLVLPGEEGYEVLKRHFAPNPGERCLVHVSVSRVSTSCGFGVPILKYHEERETLNDWAASKGPEALAKYRVDWNARSVDGLAALPRPIGEGG